MYSKVKTQSDEERNAQRAKKRIQLVELLVNKFRNKYNINGSSEMEID